jgi:SOS response associated peptidase (SRAP)
VPLELGAALGPDGTFHVNPRPHRTPHALREAGPGKCFQGSLQDGAARGLQARAIRPPEVKLYPLSEAADAHLWSEWRRRVNDETLVTCTMIITKANSVVGAIHDRMPVLLDHEDTKAWLSGEAGVELLKPAPKEVLRMWPVSRRVRKPGNGDDPSLIEPVAVHASAEPATLFRMN